MKRAGALWLVFGVLIALGGGGSEAQENCTPEGLEQMRGIGMTEDQIRAACPNVAAVAPDAGTGAADPAGTPEGSGRPGSIIGDPSAPAPTPPSGFDGAWDLALRRTSCNSSQPPDPLGQTPCTNPVLEIEQSLGGTTWHITEDGGTVQIRAGVQNNNCVAGEPLGAELLALDGNTLDVQTTLYTGFNTTVKAYQVTYDPGSDTWRGVWAEVWELPDLMDPNRVYQTRFDGEVVLTRNPSC